MGGEDLLCACNATPLKQPAEPAHLRFVAKNPTGLPSAVGVFAQQVVSTREFVYYHRNCGPEFQVIPSKGGPVPGSY